MEPVRRKTRLASHTNGRRKRASGYGICGQKGGWAEYSYSRLMGLHCIENRSESLSTRIQARADQRFSQSRITSLYFLGNFCANRISSLVDAGNTEVHCCYTTWLRCTAHTANARKSEEPSAKDRLALRTSHPQPSWRPRPFLALKMGARASGAKRR
ncbi:hypothetical protein BJX68DRAFT_138379 [Aspergillus pseudodeflectus]|uniref:Uncharacterized protein n=1 Tax=Aspergillus pseudodeflectus TaxID=176178 RepID=A0ABR4JY26_9EURO